MLPSNTIAVWADKDVETEMQSIFPSFRVIGANAFSEVRSLIRSRAIGLFATGVDHPNPVHLRRLLSVASEAASHDVIALFVAHSPRDYSSLRDLMATGTCVGVALGTSEIRPMVNLLRGRASQWTAAAATPAAQPARDALDAHPLLSGVTAFLRNPDSGRLDAKRVAEFYGEPLKKFAVALGVTPSAVSQTPDSRKYQDFLSAFERVARVVPLLENRTSFSVWAHTPSKELKGGTPIEYLWGGPAKARQLADIVEEVLVGQPD